MSWREEQVVPRAPVMFHGSKPGLVGLDLSATRVRAAGASGQGAETLLVDGALAELPLAVSLEGRTPQSGRGALGLVHLAPHLACVGYLPFLGKAQEWTAGRHRLDAARALTLVLDRVRSTCGTATGIVVALPPYLSYEQAQLVVRLAEKARLPVCGWLPAPLAATLAAYAEQPWSGTAFVVDVDDHALTWSAVTVGSGEARCLDMRELPRLGLRAWEERLLAAIAARCVRQNRRDPRDSAAAEQGLYDQLGRALDACARGQMAEIVVEMTGWCREMILRPEEIAGCCAGLVRQALAALYALRDVMSLADAQGVILLTAAAGRLPGLATALEEDAGPVAPPPVETPDSEDFGEALLEEEIVSRPRVSVLGADAVAAAACALAGRCLRGELPRGGLTAAPLPAPLPADAGPARVQFRNQDHVIRGASFVMGRHTDCDLVFDSQLYPTVSGRHCEIVYERRTFILRDRSRNGTLVNERSILHEIVLQGGDWIRLGPGGPLLRFLGRAADQLKLMTTA